MKEIPIGIQAFSSLIKGNLVYLDKTDMIYRIANKRRATFSRARGVSVKVLHSVRCMNISTDRNNILKQELQDLIRKELKAFYGVLKTCDEKIKMAFVTGVTKFSKVSFFSDVNNLKDISTDIDFATLCGATEQEIHDNLDFYVQRMADRNDMTKEECYKELKKWYEGFHFHQDSVDIYNPF